MTSTRGVDPEILGRLAERLSETGKALKEVTALSVQIQNNVTELQTILHSMDERVRSMEATINGNGSEGLKTRIAVAERDISSSIDDIKGRVASIEHSVSLLGPVDNTRSNRLGSGFFIGLLGIFIAFASMFASCGPQLVKAWSPNTSTVVPANGNK